MSKPKRSPLTCSCGVAFEADIYRSINVSAEPGLKPKVLAGQLNVFRCPSCGLDVDADVPFLYHDSDLSSMVWVYPRSSQGQAEQIRDKLRRSREILGTALPPTSVDAQRDVVFGIDGLIRWLGESPAG
ncbi:MAG TPA: CpXC domain-containing protein [Chloroflexota bacterium]|nr:CpXC domain-containing protein [Chloroflexota bacterium]